MKDVRCRSQNWREQRTATHSLSISRDNCLMFLFFFFYFWFRYSHGAGYFPNCNLWSYHAGEHLLAGCLFCYLVAYLSSSCCCSCWLVPSWWKLVMLQKIVLSSTVPRNVSCAEICTDDKVVNQLLCPWGKINCWLPRIDPVSFVQGELAVLL